MEIKYIKKTEVSSTNSLASSMINSGEIVDTTVMYTSFQSRGKGLGENAWISQENKNLLFSLVVFPDMNIEYHFNLNMIISLAICDYLNLKGVLAKIKWPNDIYVKNDKIAGILVENNLYGDIIQSSIVGVGLNLNQTEFPTELSNPVSVKSVLGKDFIIENEIREISQIIFNKIQDYKTCKFETIKSEYLEKLFRFSEFFQFKANDQLFEGKIVDIKKDGFIVICDSQRNEKEYYFKEVEYII